MIRWREGVAGQIRRSWAGAVELDVQTTEGLVPALAYVDLVGRPEPGDRVLLNTTAYALGLGTGGFALVVALPDRLPPDRDGPGHLVKARYSPLQATVLGIDEQDSPAHGILRDADDLAGLPVVIADLHSALPAVLAGLYDARPGTSVAYVMTDGAALPLALSRTVAGLVDAGWLGAGTITVGQAFGGDLEAATLHTGLLAARLVLGAEVVVVTQGPGNLGTGTRWGFTGVAAGEAVNAVAVLHGRPVAALRVSEADPRTRHQGVSHHSLTAYGRVALAAADVVVPELPGPFGERVRKAVDPLGERHRLVEVPTGGLDAALRLCPVTLSSMGRNLARDHAYFVGCAAAGRHAARLLDHR
ncbi:DUF3866 family protein [Actinopolymorpha pittospori]